MKTETKGIIKLPVRVAPAKFGPVGRDINDASGKYIATAYIPEAAARIATALNGYDKMLEALEAALYEIEIARFSTLGAQDLCAKLRSAIAAARGKG